MSNANLTGKTPILSRMTHGEHAREFGLLLVLVAVVIAVFVRAPVFLSTRNIWNVLSNTSILAIMSVGMMMVFVTGGIDISAAATLAFSGMATAIIISSNWWIPPLLAVAIGTLIGTGLGIVNGFLVVKMGIHPIITTLGTMSIFRGATFIINFMSDQGSWIGADQFSDPFKLFARLRVAGIPSLVLIAALVYIVFYYFLYHTRTGRMIYATGSNSDGARNVGVPVDRVKLLAYALAGTLAGLCGVLWVSRYASAQTNTAMGFEFVVITATVLGGTKITGGSGSLLGVLFGVLLIGIINNAINLVGVNPFWQNAINGFIVLAAITIDKVVADRSERILTERRRVWNR